MTPPDEAPAFRGPTPPPAPATEAPSRRGVLRAMATLGLGTGIGLAGGFAGAGAFTSPDGPGATPGAREAAATDRPAGVPPHGRHQAGVDRPGTPQRHGSVLILALPALTGATPRVATTLRDLCATAGEAVTAVTSDGAQRTGLLDGPGDLSVTIGLGPRLLQLVDASLPGAEDLPAFAGDEGITAEHRGGDLLVAAYSSDPNDAELAARWVAAQLPGAQPKWSQRGFRAPGAGTVTRSPLGFHDGVIVPRGEAELDEHVWLADGPLAGATICVVRRLRLDTTRFRDESVARQEEIVGRRRQDGSPLSGGGPDDEVDVLAKSPTGALLTPARSHVRAAHPSFTDSHLMLRRGYSYDNGGDDSGLMFICFQRELRTFVQTQHRLDETDDLMAYATPTASGTFLILPGLDTGRPLGSSLPG